MKLVILFDGNNFNNFPIDIFESCRENSDIPIIYVNYKFHPSDNKKFLKKIIIKGIKLIYLVDRT